MSARKSYRKMHKFWLEMYDDAQRELAGAIVRLKSDGLFTDYIRKGLALMLSLATGDTAVLRDLFPAVVRGIEEAYHSDELARLNARLDELTGIIEANGLKAPAEKPIQRRHTVPTPPSSATITVSKSTAASPAANFMKAMAAFKNEGAETE